MRGERRGCDFDGGFGGGLDSGDDGMLITIFDAERLVVGEARGCGATA